MNEFELNSRNTHSHTHSFKHMTTRGGSTAHRTNNVANCRRSTASTVPCSELLLQSLVIASHHFADCVRVCVCVATTSSRVKRRCSTFTAPHMLPHTHTHRHEWSRHRNTVQQTVAIVPRSVCVCLCAFAPTRLEKVIWRVCAVRIEE